MEKDKSRGIKHIKDKQKYKGNSTKNPKYVPPKISPKNLGSNWDRYDSDEEYDDGEENTNSRGDFEILANAPISTGSHFQFKADQAKEIEEIKYNSSNIFNLNLEALHQSIMGISFYERLGIDKEYFTPEEIKIMDKEAKQHLKEKIKIIEQEEDTPSNKAPNYILGIFVDYGNSSASKRGEEFADSEEDEEDEDEEYEEDEDEGVAVEDDLEQWLDQVLDE